MTSDDNTLHALEPLVGEWIMVAEIGDTPATDIGARVTFEWLPGQQFLEQRWSVPIPEAPDGVAIIGPNPDHAGEYLQHYFDSRGVARVYRMTLRDGVWTLWRDTPDFSPLDFSQRYTGTFGDDGKEIAGAWEISNDGETWELDFNLTYQKLG